MKLEVENRCTIIKPTKVNIERNLNSLKSYRSPSFAALIKDDGDYIQVAGGGGTCAIERYDAQSGEMYRAFSDRLNPAFPNETALVFGGGQLLLKTDEWFTINHAISAFFDFFSEHTIAGLKWRSMEGRL